MLLRDLLIGLPKKMIFQRKEKVTTQSAFR
jgi:hypothetical protein